MILPRTWSFWLSLTLAAVALGGCKKDSDITDSDSATGTVDIVVQNVVGAQALVLNTGNYTTEPGDPFTVTTFNYYLSNIRLLRADGTAFVQPESYYLVKQSDAASQRFTIPAVPPGDYTGVTFTIGVDSARNVAGAQQAALDPLNGMFWNWNTGYVFLKMEGTSPRTANGQLVIHVGGFTAPYNAVRPVSPSFNGQVMRVGQGATPQLHLRADLLKLFSGVRLSDASVASHMPGANAVAVANRYSAGMFTVDRIQPTN